MTTSRNTISHRTGVSTFASRTSRHTTKVFNRACKADPKEKLFLKNFQSFKKNKKRNAQPTRQ
jgi:GH35 family endo-1,4-beta-xylanase